MGRETGQARRAYRGRRQGLKVVWLARALMDRDSQLDHIASGRPRAAVDQGDQIERQVDMLADYAEMGRLGRKPGTRELVVVHTPFVIVYRVRARLQRIEILRLLHGAQKWPPD